jgi:hypothetical protein
MSGTLTKTFFEKGFVNISMVTFFLERCLNIRAFSLGKFQSANRQAGASYPACWSARWGYKNNCGLLPGPPDAYNYND